jgi:hypothetical protein
VRDNLAYKKKDRPSSLSSPSSPVAAPGIGVEHTFAGVWGKFAPFGKMNDKEWEEEKEKGARVVRAEIAARKEAGVRERKRKDNERAKERYAAKKKSRRKRREKNRKRRKRKRRKRKKGRVRGYKGIYNLLFIISLAFSSPLTLPPNTPGCLDLLELIRSRLN